MPFKDKEKARTKNAEYQRKWFRNNRKTQYKRVKERSFRNRIWIHQYKSEQSCKECGISHPAVLDFHHRDGEKKKFSISQCKDSGLKRIKAEIKKCDVLCANCHRLLHWENCSGPFTNRKMLKDVKK